MVVEWLREREIAVSKAVDRLDIPVAILRQDPMVPGLTVLGLESLLLGLAFTTSFGVGQIDVSLLVRRVCHGLMLFRGCVDGCDSKDKAFYRKELIDWLDNIECTPPL